MKKFWLLFPVLAVVLSVAGCVSNTSGMRIEEGCLIVDNPRFASHFRVLHHLKQVKETGFTYVQLVVQNTGEGDVRFQYRFQWKDADGFWLEETAPTWQVATIHGKDTVALDAVSEHRNIADFRVVLRCL